MSSIAPRAARLAASTALCALALSAPLMAAQAQSLIPAAPAALSTPASLRPPDPLNAQAALPPLIYRSALQGYRPNVEAGVADWPAANERVGRLGGWRAYAREAQQPAASSAPTASPAGQPKPAHAHPPQGLK